MSYPEIHAALQVLRREPSNSRPTTRGAGRPVKARPLRLFLGRAARSGIPHVENGWQPAVCHRRHNAVRMIVGAVRTKRVAERVEVADQVSDFMRIEIEAIIRPQHITGA